MMYYGFAPFGWLFMLIFWCLIIGVIVALARGGFGKGFMCGHNHGEDMHGKDKTPLDILKERYAKGEIDKKELEERKKNLG